jgi:hypothetical protein
MASSDSSDRCAVTLPGKDVGSWIAKKTFSAENCRGYGIHARDDSATMLAADQA